MSTKGGEVMIGTQCKVCGKSGCWVTVPPDDVKVVAAGLRDVFGRRLRWPLRALAAQLVHGVAAVGRLGEGPRREEGWSPPAGDCEEFGGLLGNLNGAMRLWRAEEIAFYGLRALGRAGRLLDASPVRD